ncbi:helix-turn-helix transcriptional regulator [Streptomyces sp. NPDC052051]|uniref:helix-turn-helix domain-containing protein n=1 Tax=Streptomyces sp. NPDC052051 TaxID=3154649 RepID=UPI0034129B9B
MFNRHKFTARRIALGMTVEGLAQQLQVSPSTIYRWESGSTCPSLSTLVPASRILCTSLLTLIDEDDSEWQNVAKAIDSMNNTDKENRHA